MDSYYEDDADYYDYGDTEYDVYDNDEYGYDAELEDDMGALRRACELSGQQISDIQDGEDNENDDLGYNQKEEEEESDDAMFLQEIQKKLGTATTNASQFQVALLGQAAMSKKPLEDHDSDEDDADILQSIRNRFSTNSEESPFTPPLPKQHTTLTKEHSAGEGNNEMRKVQNINEHGLISYEDNVCGENQISGLLEAPPLQTSEISQELVAVKTPRYQGIPPYARALIDALKKNRSCQRVLQNKLVHIEAKMEENEDLRNRVKCLSGFETASKRRLRQHFKEDTYSTFKLITHATLRAKRIKQTTDHKIIVNYRGPPENQDVSQYNLVRKSFPDSLERKPWSTKETENLLNGLKQQLQETLVSQAMQNLLQGNHEDVALLDDQLSVVSGFEIKSENIRLFLPQVDWEKLASAYVPGHSGGDCRARWLNAEDPLINRTPWSKDEDKRLLQILQHNGLHNWVHIANALGTNRTPFQCLTRFQRSLNANIMKKEWTEEEDEQLRAVVQMFGENDWQMVAAHMDGRTGAQCLNRWYKSIHPDRKKTGRWTVEEDKRLKLAVIVYGPKTWKKVASVVSGRTEVQCRERWCNVLDPALKLDRWTKDEDDKLIEAASIHGFCWAKVASCLAPRTDNQCWRRWKFLHPKQLAVAQKAGKVRKAALISNFVGRRKEKPEIGANDFIFEEDEASTPKNNERLQQGSRTKKKKTCVRAEKDVALNTMVSTVQSEVENGQCVRTPNPDHIVPSNTGQKKASKTGRKRTTKGKSARPECNNTDDANANNGIEAPLLDSQIQISVPPGHEGELSHSGSSVSKANSRKRTHSTGISNMKNRKLLETQTPTTSSVNSATGLLVSLDNVEDSAASGRQNGIPRLHSSKKRMSLKKSCENQNDRKIKQGVHPPKFLSSNNEDVTAKSCNDGLALPLVDPRLENEVVFGKMDKPVLDCNLSAERSSSKKRKLCKNSLDPNFDTGRRELESRNLMAESEGNGLFVESSGINITDDEICERVGYVGSKITEIGSLQPVVSCIHEDGSLQLERNAANIKSIQEREISLDELEFSSTDDGDLADLLANSLDSNSRLGLHVPQDKDPLSFDLAFPESNSPAQRLHGTKRKAWRSFLDSDLDTVQGEIVHLQNECSQNVQNVEAVKTNVSCMLGNTFLDMESKASSIKSVNQKEIASLLNHELNNDKMFTDSARLCKRARHNKWNIKPDPLNSVKLNADQSLTVQQESPDLRMSTFQGDFTIDPLEVLNLGKSEHLSNPSKQASSHMENLENRVAVTTMKAESNLAAVQTVFEKREDYGDHQICKPKELVNLHAEQKLAPVGIDHRVGKGQSSCLSNFSDVQEVALPPASDNETNTSTETLFTRSALSCLSDNLRIMPVVSHDYNDRNVHEDQGRANDQVTASASSLDDHSAEVSDSFLNTHQEFSRNAAEKSELINSQPRSRRATRQKINYKELLNGRSSYKHLQWEGK